MTIKPWPHQRKAIDKLKNGSVLVGGTGGGKSLVAVVYFIEKVLGVSIDPMEIPTTVVDLFVITTPKKRNDLDWELEAGRFGISTNPEVSIGGITLKVDSWNNIKKYTPVRASFFIFDEQRAIGSGAWAKAFIKITKNNKWIMLSATPADRWIDLVPVFVANGLYRNRTAFIAEHVIYSPYTTFPSIKMYLNTPKLVSNRNSVFVIMPFKRHTNSIVKHVEVSYPEEVVKELAKTEWNPFTDLPIRTAPEHRHVERRLVNSDPSRILAAEEIFNNAKRLIIFYNFNYELDALKKKFTGITTVAEYNGHKHESLPTGLSWVYLVQYTSGNEAWECFTTQHMLFYSANYSYRVTTQAMGRINRMTTTFEKLYYYKLVSKSRIDQGVMNAFANGKDFNERTLTYV